MRKSIFAAAFTLLGAAAFAQNTEKNLIQTINPENSTQIVLSIDAPVELKQWDESNIRVIIDVKLLNGNESVLEQLVLAGRYKLEAKKEGDTYVITSPNLAKKVTVRGEELKESITATVYPPQYAKIEMKDGEVSLVKGLSPELEELGLAAKGEVLMFKAFDSHSNFSCQSGGPTVAATEITIGGVTVADMMKK